MTVKLAIPPQKRKSGLIAMLFGENQRLREQRIKDLEQIDAKNNKILEQQNEIISLYSRLNNIPVMSVMKGGIL